MEKTENMGKMDARDWQACKKEQTMRQKALWIRGDEEGSKR